MSSVVDVVLRVKNALVRTGLQRAKQDFARFSKDVNRLGSIAIFGGFLLQLRQSFRRTREFSRQMKEVFTLLPGLSKAARRSMAKDVRALAQEMRILPEMVVPALYQAISAGVPKDNVFHFLRTSAQAAKGGVTELATSVDGISSVVNAYGAEVLGAQKASDLMFTAVRLGKTTFDEMAQSVFQVTPLASALGVEFEEVTAALAALTAKGTPTAVAMTQIRALLADLAKEGSKSGAMFEKMAGISFVEFIRRGGSLYDALQVIQRGADESGTELLNLFKRIEAGSAALSLLSDDKFAEALREMGAAAGATQAAFDEMNSGIDATMTDVEVRFKTGLDRMMGWVQEFSVAAGERLGTVAGHMADRVEGGGNILTGQSEASRIAEWRLRVDAASELEAEREGAGVNATPEQITARVEEMKRRRLREEAATRNAFRKNKKGLIEAPDSSAAPTAEQDPVALARELAGDDAAAEEEAADPSAEREARALSSARQRERAAARDLRLSRLSDEDRRAALAQEQAQAMAQAKIADEAGLGADAAALRTRGLELQQQLERGAGGEDANTGGGFSRAANSLHEVGLASANVSTPQNFAQERQIVLQEQMVETLAAIASNTDPDIQEGPDDFATFAG